MQKYVEHVDAAFPTNILLAISSDDVEFDGNRRRMKVRRAPEVATVIDGQHRIAGLEETDQPFQMVVTIFIDMDIEDKALVFSTINLKQTRVNPSLARDLFELAKSPSPQKTAHTVARALNTDDKSPLFHRIKMLGVATEGRRGETVTQALLVDSFLDMLSWQPDEDRNLIKKDRRHRRDVTPIGTSEQRRRYPFRDAFRDDRDEILGRNVLNLFDATREVWPDAWGNLRQGNMLNRTTGVFVLLRFLRERFATLDDPFAIIPTRDFARRFRRTGLEDRDFSSERFPSGGQGRAVLWREVFEPMVP